MIHKMILVSSAITAIQLFNSYKQLKKNDFLKVN